jgi:hypothetical protein
VTATPTQVSVTVTITHHTTLLRAAGITTLAVTGTSTARPLPGLRVAGTTPSGQGS